MSFFNKQSNNCTDHLRIQAAKTRDEIKLESDIPIPVDPRKKKQSSGADLWDEFWNKVRVTQSFVVTDTFAQTVKASAAKRGIVLKTCTVGPFKTRVWRMNA